MTTRINTVANISELKTRACTTQLLLQREDGVKFPEDPEHLSDIFVAIVAKILVDGGTVPSMTVAKDAVRKTFVHMAEKERQEYEERTECYGHIVGQSYREDDVWYNSMRMPCIVSLGLMESWVYEELAGQFLKSSLDDEDFDFEKDKKDKVVLDKVLYWGGRKYLAIHKSVWYKYLREHRANSTSNT